LEIGRSKKRDPGGGLSGKGLTEELQAVFPVLTGKKKEIEKASHGRQSEDQKKGREESLVCRMGEG